MDRIATTGHCRDAHGNGILVIGIQERTLGEDIAQGTEDAA